MFGILLHDERSLGFSSIHLFLLAKKKMEVSQATRTKATPYAIADKIEIDVSNLERVFESLSNIKLFVWTLSLV